LQWWEAGGELFKGGGHTLSFFFQSIFLRKDNKMKSSAAEGVAEGTGGDGKEQEDEDEHRRMTTRTRTFN
jgi:hypothetical protein